MKTRQRTRYLTAEEEAKLLTTLPEGVKRDACAFLLDTGARERGLGLSWDDLKHHRALDRVAFWRTKTRRVRTLPLTARAMDCLIRARAEGRLRPFPVRYHAFFIAFAKAQKASSPRAYTPSTARHRA